MIETGKNQILLAKSMVMKKALKYRFSSSSERTALARSKDSCSDRVFGSTSSYPPAISDVRPGGS
jgi:hypothetical protein